MRDPTAYPITKNHLCFVCHGEPDKGQEDFDWCCCHPGNAFLCKKHVGLYSKICWIRTGRHYQSCILSEEDVFHSHSNRGEGLAVRKLIGHVRPLSSSKSQSRKYDQLVGWASYCLWNLPGPQLILTISCLYRSEIKFYKPYLLLWSIELAWLEFK